MLKIVLVLAVVAIIGTNGHGRFMRPPNRSSLWRVPEFANQNPPTNYDDDSLLCGYVHQSSDPGTDCGVCGDPVSSVRPRANEIGGRYDKGIIAATYTAGQTIDIEVELTAAHLGHMEWRLCTNPSGETQDCFNQNLLQRADGQGSKLMVDQGSGWYRTQLRLPAGVRCNRCIIQWNYRAGNNPGNTQETFRGCSDVRIN